MTSSKSTTTDYPVGVFTSVFTGNELFLADHIIQGKKILPGMAYLELARAAVANSVKVTDKQMIVLRDSLFIQAMLVSETCTVEVKVYPGAPGEFGVEVSTDQVIHFQTKVLIESRQAQTTEAKSPVSLDIQSLEQQCTKAGPTKQQFYENMRKRHVVLGPSHRGIESIKIGKECALVKVSLPGSSNRGMAMDPGMLDSFIQSAIAISSNPEANVVPFAVKRTQIFGPLTDTMYAHVVNTDQGVDYTIADDKGEVKVIVTGFQAREIDLNAQQDQLVFYKPEWQEETESANEEADKNITIVKAQKDYRSLVKSIITTAQKLIQDKTDKHVIALDIAKDKPSWKGIIALLKTVALEYPKISYRLKTGNKIIKLGYSEVDMTTASKYTWPDNKTILITGGLGGVGKLIARDIAENSKGCTLILVGRSTLTDEKRAFVKRLETLGAQIRYIQCDITKQTEVADLVAKHPQINGVIHGSGINKDNLISKKNPDEIDQVLAPKVDGLEYLDQATTNLKLDFFVTLSSIAGTLGNAGQTDYAAANGYMDAYMHNRAQQVKAGKCYGKSISINWPLWESDGMQLNEATKQNLLQVFKIKPLPAASGLTALKQILGSDQQQLIVLFGNKKAIRTMFDKDKATTARRVQEKTPGVEADKLSKALLQEVKNQVAEHLKRQPDHLDETADWAEFGFDSILLASFINKFNTRFSLNLMPTVLFEATNINQLSRYLADNFAAQMQKKLSLTGEEQPIAAPDKTLDSPVDKEQTQISTFAQGFKKKYNASVAYRDIDMAIVGISCRIAGARNPREFWKMLDEEKDMISEIPKDRWDWRDYPGVSKWGSFIDVAEFDPLFFGISPAETLYMAPEQRLMMQYVWECLEDAGYSADDLKGTDTGLFVGCGPSTYVDALSVLPVEAYSATGMVPSVGPNRVSYIMDWNGPSNPIDTACSSALVALHRAVEAVRAGHCSQAIVGGANALLSPSVYISFSKSGMLCEDGKCKTFSDKANGYVRGEGVGMLMIKPLKAAIKDGNTIYAVVKGTAENHNGHTNSLTAPSPRSQAAVIKKAIKDAGIDFSRVGYIECHGTGTSLGDPIEIEGLKMAASDLLKDGDQSPSIYLGSIKSNIGHLEYAAGIVGLIKAILQMKHKKIAKSLYCDNINPYINLKDSPFVIAQKASDWNVAPGQTRVAGVSSFGFGGVNAHVVLEEFQPANTQQGQMEDAHGHTQIIPISAKTEESLINYVTQFRDYVKTMDKSAAVLKRVAYTLQVGRSEMPERLAFVVDSFEDWESQMDAFMQSNGKVNNRKIHRGTVKARSPHHVPAAENKTSNPQLLEVNEPEKIAESWVMGTKIDWQVLYKY